MVDLLAQARLDFAEISQGEFSTQISIQPTLVSTATSIKCLASKHHFAMDGNGIPVNSKNVHITISESALIAAGYTVRNADKEVNLINHFVTFSDSSGNSWIYKITQTMPDECLGLITCFLNDYE